MRKIYNILLIISVLFSVNIWAQDAKVFSDTIVQSTHTLSGVEVVASKEKHDLFKLPMRSTQLSAEAINKQQIQSLRGLTALVPNLYMPDYGSKLTAPIYIRGVGSRINSPSVGLYVDGVPYFEKAAFDFALFDIASIEVLSGPQGTLYGRNTMGGIINVRSRLPQGKRSTQVRVGAGNYENYHATVQHSQPLGKKCQLQLGGLWKQGHYEVKNAYTDKYVDKQTNGLGRMKFVYKPTDKLRFVLSSQYDQSEQKGYPYALYNDKTNSIQAVNYNHESTYKRSLFSNSLHTTYAFKSMLLEAVTAHQYLSDNQDVDQDFMPVDMFEAQQKQHINTLSQEVYLKSKPQANAKYEWISGVFAFHQQVDKDVNVHYGADALPVLHLPAQMYYLKQFDNTNTAWAIFHQSTFKNLFVEGLSLQLGLRYDNEHSHLDYTKNTFLTANNHQLKADAFDSKLNFSQWIPKLGLSYHITPLAHTYISLSKGYKVGGFNTSFAQEKDRSYAPEYSWNYEWGIKAKLWHQRVHTALSVFYIDWRDQQVYQPVLDANGAFQPGSLLQNAARARSQGVEWSATAYLNQHWQLNGRFGYTDASYLDYSKKSKTGISVYDGNKLPYVPAYTFYVDARYSVNLHTSYLQSISVVLSYSGIGKHYWKEDNVAYQDYYGLLNTSITLSNARWQMVLWAKNLLGAEYNAFYFRSLGRSYAQAGRPMMMGVKIGFTI